jgi:hypothetical protein
MRVALRPGAAHGILEFQNKWNPYTKQTLITKENIKLFFATDRHTITSQSATPALFFRVIGRPPVTVIGKHQHRSSTRTHHHSWTWSYPAVSPSAPTFIGNFLCRLATITSPADPHFINPRCVSKIRVQKRCQHK